MKRLWDTELEQERRRTSRCASDWRRCRELGGAGTIVTTHVDRALDDFSGGDREAAVDIFRHLVTRSGTKIALAAPDLAEYSGQSGDEIQELLERLTRATSASCTRPAVAGRRRRRGSRSRTTCSRPRSSTGVREFCKSAQRHKSPTRCGGAICGCSIGTGALLALVAVLTTLSIWALHQRQNARDATGHARWLAVASTAKDLADSRLGDSLVLGLAANQNDPTTAARSAMTSALEQAEESGARTILIGHTGAVVAIDGSSDGVVASGGQDGTVRLWSVARGREIGGPMTRHVGAVRAVAFSPDGQTIASGGDDKRVRLWARRSQKLVRGIPLGDAAIGIAFSPDGTLLAVASKEGRVYIIDPHASSQPHVLQTGGTPI